MHEHSSDRTKDILCVWTGFRSDGDPFENFVSVRHIIGQECIAVNKRWR